MADWTKDSEFVIYRYKPEFLVGESEKLLERDVDVDFLRAEKDISAIEWRRRATSSFHHERRNSSSEEEEKVKMSSSERFPSSLLVKLPAPVEESTVKEDDGGFKTPTSLDQKIPAIFPCPPPPRKSKSDRSSKRKGLRRDRVFIDLSEEIESMFPSVFEGVDFRCKIKKCKQSKENDRSVL